jgi:hypothetical protein
MTDTYSCVGVDAHGITTRVHRPDGSVEDVLLIPSFNRCTVFLYALTRGRMKNFGTAFVISEPVPRRSDKERVYLVTARHVIEKIRRCNDDAMVHIRCNAADGRGAFWESISDEMWWWHPNDRADIDRDEWLTRDDSWPRYDIAATDCPERVASGETSDLAVIPSALALSESDAESFRIAPGEEIAITGMYARHVGDARNIPLVRVGTIAALPSLAQSVVTGLGLMHGCYLIEARSIGGLSGSPVFWMSGTQRVNAESKLYSIPASVIRLIGLVHGHYDTDESTEQEPINEGIAIVAPVSHILETLRREEIVNRNSRRDKELPPEPGGAAMDSARDDDDRVSLDGVDAEDALRALLKTPPHGQTQDPA